MLTTSEPSAPEAVMVGGYYAESEPIEGGDYWEYDGYAEHVIVPEPGTFGLCLCALAIGLVWRRRAATSRTR